MNCCCYREKIIEKLLNEWQVEVYATNLFLYKIPIEKIIAQRNIIKNSYDNSSFYCKMIYQLEYLLSDILIIPKLI